MIRKLKWQFVAITMSLILIVLIGLVVIFKKEATSIVNSLFEKITSQADKL